MRKSCYQLVKTFFLILVVLSCKTAETTPTTKNSQTTPTALNLSGITGATSNFAQATNTYTFIVPIGTNIKALAMTFSLPTGATVSPASGSTQDFTNPITYTITAENGTIVKYIVKVVIQAPPKSSAKQILGFSFEELKPIIKLSINYSTFEISGEIPSSANIKMLKPTITISDKASVSPNTLMVQDFSNPVKYTVVAEDGTIQIYNVKATQAKSTISGGPGIYLSGYYNSGDYNHTPVIWKNDVMYPLSSGNLGIAYSLYVTDSDVYAVGNVGNVATVWKNGIASNLTDGKEFSIAYDVVVNDNDVYIAGYDGKIAKYWKNGIAVSLSDGKYQAKAHSILIIDNDVFVCGSESFEYGYISSDAVVWKNGKKIETLPNLKTEKVNSSAMSIVKNENSTNKYCVLWEVNYSDGFYYHASCVKDWNDANPGGIFISNEIFKPNSLAANNNKIYVVGTTFGGCASYYNPSSTQLIKLESDCLKPGNSSSALTMTFLGNDIYVAGGQNDYATYWKNGKTVWVDKTKGTGVSDIFVK
jgi:hypothetical protein